MKRMTVILCVLALLWIACYAWARSTVVSVVQGAAAAPAGITGGTFEYQALTSGTTEYDISATIPAGTSAIVVAVSNYSFYSGNPLVSAALDPTGSNTAFTVDQNLDPASDLGVGIGHLFTTTTGAKTIRVTTGSFGADGGRIYLVYYSGTASDGLRDSDVATSGAITLTTSAGDVVVTAAMTDDDTSITFSNATKFTSSEFTTGAGNRGAIAYTTADGASETVSVSTSTVYSLASIVLKPGS
jgi:hypothetical protein